MKRVLLAICLFSLLALPCQAQGGLVRTTPPPAPPDPWAAFYARCAWYESSWLRIDDEEFVWQQSGIAFRWYYGQIDGYPYVLVAQVNGGDGGVISSAIGGIQAPDKVYPYGAWTISGTPSMVDIPYPDTFGVVFTRTQPNATQTVRFRVYRPRLPWEFQPN